ncbi:MAG: hypothetical protein QME74_03570 [Candidatus Edwardsbacteria bacterium]|nr:hypothetical protein [Candidatus Edwardsbacteria bacterium]
MKKLTLVLALILSLSLWAFAQDESAPEGSSGTSAVAGEAAKAFGASMMGGLGITTIDGKLYCRVQLVPELAFGKFGMGVDADLLFNDKGIRKEDWKPASRWVRIIRYLRYGQKHDNFYARLGALDAATLGHGSLMYRYSNRIDDVERKIGLEFDADFGMFGMESVVSTFGRAEIYGGRGYVRPLKTTEIPVIKNFEVGLSAATDVDPDQNRGTKEKVGVYGFDLGLPLINTSLLYTTLYYDFGKIDKLGSGSVVGVSTDIHLPGGIVDLGAKLEQRFLGKKFVSQYFDWFYEFERCQTYAGPAGAYNIYKSDVVAAIDAAKNGTYGELVANVIGKFVVTGSYQYTYKTPKSGILHFETDLSKLVPKAELRAAYDQKGVGEPKDMFRMDEHFLVTVEGGYEVYSHVMLYITYLRTYERRTQDKDDSGVLLPPYYKAVEKFSPRVAVKFNF